VKGELEAQRAETARLMADRRRQPARIRPAPPAKIEASTQKQPWWPFR
jgi:hypothetical protein